jgi:hypothetical protein
MDKRFTSAFTDPGLTKLLGRFVSPFCLLHRVQLEAAESPLLRSGADVRPLDLLVAVKICSGERLDRMTWKDSWQVAKMTGNKDYFAEQIDRFAEFVLVHSWPKFWEKKAKAAETSGIPWPLSVVSSLIANGIPEERAWTMPECQAIWLNASFAISKGAELKVLTSEDEELIEELEKTQA